MKIKIYALCLCMLCSTIYSGEIEPISFDHLAQKMPKLNQTLLEMHLTLYRGYVKQVNALNMRLDELERKRKDWNETDTFLFQSVQRQYGFEYDGMKLHELYFKNLGGVGSLAMAPSLKKLIKKSFGSYEKWEKEFRAVCKMRGIGWVILYLNPQTMTLRNGWVQEHSMGLLADEVPILVVDLWEHAYICQFGLDRMGYIDVILPYIDWEVCEARVMKALCESEKPMKKPKRARRPSRPKS